MSCKQEVLEKRKMWKWAYEEFSRRINRCYEDKVKYTEELMRKVIQKDKGKVVISSSFGKDSTVMIHIGIKYDPQIPVIFANTGVEFPQTLKFKEFLTKEWNLNLIETGPEISFWDVVKKHGYPKPRTWSFFREKKNPGIPHCCYHLKEKPLGKIYEKYGIKTVFVGLTWDESNIRKMLIVQKGDDYITDKNAPFKIRKILPLAYWNTKDVWRYIQENNLPINEIYKLTDRNGCMPCTSYKGWMETMARTTPKLYKKIVHDMGIKLLEDFGIG